MLIAFVSLRGKVWALQAEVGEALRAAETVQGEFIILQADLASIKTELEALRLVRENSAVQEGCIATLHEQLSSASGRE